MAEIKRVERGLSATDLCRELGINSASFYKWRAKFCGMDVSLMSRMQDFELENQQLKKLYVEAKIDIYA